MADHNSVKILEDLVWRFNSKTTSFFWTDDQTY